MDHNYYALVEDVDVGEITKLRALYYARSEESCEQERRKSWSAPHRVTAIIRVSKADYDATVDYPTEVAS
jgi:hypothetical protein